MSCQSMRLPTSHAQQKYNQYIMSIFYSITHFWHIPVVNLQKEYTHTLQLTEFYLFCNKTAKWAWIIYIPFISSILPMTHKSSCYAQIQP